MGLFSLFILSSLFATVLLGEPIRAVVLIPNRKAICEDTEELLYEEIWFKGLDPPGKLDRLTTALTTCCFGKEWSVGVEASIKQAIYRYYQQEGHPFITLSIPPQDKNSGVLQIVVTEALLGKIEVEGARYTSTKQLKRYFDLQPGKPISTKALSRGVDFVNRNPFRHADVIYSQGDELNTTDLTVQVQDRRAYRFYTGVDNTGVVSIGRTRIFAGFSWDQVFGLDHNFFYQYTTNERVNTFHANTFQYNAFLPNKTVLKLYGGYSVLHADLPSPASHSKGTNISASARYEIPLFAGYFFSQDLVAGLDIKNTNNTVEYTDLSAMFGQTVNLSQALVGYRARWERKKVILQGSLDAVFSPAQWLPGQSEADFASLRPSATNKWFYIDASFTAEGPLPYSLSYFLFLKGQWTQQVLLPSEQLGLGGYGSIRGYDARQYNADTGVLMNFELHSPKFSVIRSKEPNRDLMYFLVFLDIGQGFDNATIPEVPSQNLLASVGPGLRYFFGTYFNARLDWGIKLHHQDDFTGGPTMLQFSVSGSY